jgi:hypothetical protein
MEKGNEQKQSARKAKRQQRSKARTGQPKPTSEGSDPNAQASSSSPEDVVRNPNRSMIQTSNAPTLSPSRTTADSQEDSSSAPESQEGVNRNQERSTIPTSGEEDSAEEELSDEEGSGAASVSDDHDSEQTENPNQSGNASVANAAGAGLKELLAEKRARLQPKSAKGKIFRAWRRLKIQTSLGVLLFFYCEQSSR